jgi:molecular chaperone GrpE
MGRDKATREPGKEAGQGGEGEPSLAEEPSGGTLATSPELEKALEEAAAAVDAAAEVTAANAEGGRESAEGGRESAEGGREAAEGGQASAEAAEAPLDEMGSLRAELEETRDRLLRTQADFENFRRRALRERTEAHNYGHQNLVKDLLSAVDNLDRAIDHARSAGESGGGDLEGLLQGVELVRREFLGALARHGVNEIDALGKAFDPALHEAMAQTPDASVAPNSVIEVLEKGYQLRDRLVRPARVVVTQALEGDGESGEGEAAD